MNIGKTYLSQIQFEKLWNSIQIELALLYNNQKCSASIVYNNIYIICTSTSYKFVEDLYWKIGDFLYEILRSSKHRVYDSENWITEYTILYEKYLLFVESINELADYLNQYITSKSIYHFAFLLWERCILQSCYKYKKIHFGEHIVFHDNLDEILACIKSLKNVIVEPTNPLLYYKERYEKFALSFVIDKCTDFVDKYKKESVIDYVLEVNRFIKQEKERRIKTFLKESWQKHDMIIEDILVLQNKKWIKNEIYKILVQHTLPIEILNSIRNSMSLNREDKTNVKYFTNKHNMTYCQSSIDVKQNTNLFNSTKEEISDNFKTHGNAPQSKSNRNINCKSVHNEMPDLPLNDFYALFSNSIPNLYTYTTNSLNTIREITKSMMVLEHSNEVLESVLHKYLTTQLIYYNHLLDKNIETLYIFYTLLNHVVKVGFHNSKNANIILRKKLKEVYNALNPSLSTRLIKFTNFIVLGDCVLEKKNINLRKGFIDFFNKSEICNLNEEEGIDYWGDNELEESLPIEEDNLIDVLPFDDPYKIQPKDYPVKSLYKSINRRQISLPDLSKFPSFDYKDKALLRVFVHLYDLIEDKIDFYKRYLVDLSKRVLLLDLNYYKELEIFTLLSCEDRDLKLKGEIMFSDMKSFISTDSGVHLLTESAWPLEVDNVNIKLPYIFSKEITKFNKKRVKWAWEFSIVLVEINGKEYRLNFLQYIVINLFNIHNYITRIQIKEELQTDSALVENTIRSLIKSKILIEDGNIFILNINSKVYNIVDYFIKENINNLHEVNKEMYYLCKIANILKKYKKMKEEDLLKILSDDHTNRFVFSFEEYKISLKNVIEKGIIEKKEGLLFYIP